MNILIPYNFSESAIRALNFTKALFKDKPIKVILLDVYISNKSLLLTNQQNKEWFKEIEDNLKDELKYLIDVLNREESTFVYEYKVDSNSLLQSISNTILEKDIDLIISGTGGLVNGQDSKSTNTMKIVETIQECPIIVVPEKYKLAPIKQLVFPTNYKRAFVKKELSLLLLLSMINNCSIEVLDVSKTNELDNNQIQNKHQLEHILSELDCVYTKFSTDNLTNYLENYSNTLLVFTRYKLSFLERFFNEDIIKNLAFYGNTPMLILPDF